jgi:phospholipid/cholesterol/gamma-HCH transport system substrate-binding protein
MGMKLEYSTMEKMVGVFILLTLVIFLSAVAMVGRGKMWFRKQVSYYTTFNEGYNLTSGSRVKLFGTDVGSVTDVQLTEDNMVKVKFVILAEYASRLRTDSIATVESPTFIGSEYIAIIPGSKTAPLIPPEGMIPSREKKKLGDYLEQYEFDKRLKQFGEIIEDLAHITAQLQDPKGPLFGTLGNLQKFTAAIDEGRGTLGRIVMGEELYKKIVDELDAVSGILASLKKTTDHSAQIGANVEQMSKNLEIATQKAPDMTVQVQELLARMIKVSVLLEKAMTEAPAISHQVRESMREVNRILDSMQKSFLIRPNLPPAPVPESHGLQIRGE